MDLAEAKMVGLMDETIEDGDTIRCLVKDSARAKNNGESITTAAPSSSLSPSFHCALTMSLSTSANSTSMFSEADTTGGSV
jgi:hypothetical protein